MGGADWFESNLVDYDVHANWGQWARSAGVVPTNDAKRNRVGGTRYLDIALGTSEAQEYVRTWIPELRSLPDDEILCPWRVSQTAGYPAVPLCSDTMKHYFERSSTCSRKGKASGRSSDRSDGFG